MVQTSRQRIVGGKDGYLVNGSKSWLIVKTRELVSEAEQVFGDEVNILTEGERHLGTVIESEKYEDQYCSEKNYKWKD